MSATTRLKKEKHRSKTKSKRSRKHKNPKRSLMVTVADELSNELDGQSQIPAGVVNDRPTVSRDTPLSQSLNSPQAEASRESPKITGSSSSLSSFTVVPSRSSSPGQRGDTSPLMMSRTSLKPRGGWDEVEIEALDDELGANMEVGEFEFIDDDGFEDRTQNLTSPIRRVGEFLFGNENGLIYMARSLVPGTEKFCGVSYNAFLTLITSLPEGPTPPNSPRGMESHPTLAEPQQHDADATLACRSSSALQIRDAITSKITRLPPIYTRTLGMPVWLTQHPTPNRLLSSTYAFGLVMLRPLSAAEQKRMRITSHANAAASEHRDLESQTKGSPQ